MAGRVNRPSATNVARRIFLLRGQRVLLDTHLAALYEVSTKRLNQQVRRNVDRFPKDFLFVLTRAETEILRLHFATSSWGGRRYRPLAFTEHGAIMVAMVLSSPRAVKMSVYVMRAFVKLRQLLASNVDLARKLEELEKSVASLDTRTRKQFEEVYAAIRALMVPTPQKSRPIGFTADFEK